MKIAGIQRFTLTDYPGELACVVFLCGCNMRCPWCHNPELVINNEIPGMPEDEVLNFLESRKGKLTGVVISGGEPTLSEGLIEFISRIKEMGFKVKLDTNGTNFHCILSLVNDHLLDSVGLDFKCTRFEYKWIAQTPEVFGNFNATISLLADSDVDLEVRTTVVKGYFTLDEMESMYDYLRDVGIKRWVIQPFQFPEKGVLDKSLLSGYIDRTTLERWRESIVSTSPVDGKFLLIDLESRYM